MPVSASRLALSTLACPPHPLPDNPAPTTSPPVTTQVSSHRFSPPPTCHIFSTPPSTLQLDATRHSPSPTFRQVIMNFICNPCRTGEHDQCRGGSWCDCLHRPTRRFYSLRLITDMSRLPGSPLLPPDRSTRIRPLHTRLVPSRPSAPAPTHRISPPLPLST